MEMTFVQRTGNQLANLVRRLTGVPEPEQRSPAIDVAALRAAYSALGENFDSVKDRLLDAGQAHRSEAERVEAEMAPLREQLRQLQSKKNESTEAADRMNAYVRALQPY